LLYTFGVLGFLPKFVAERDNPVPDVSSSSSMGASNSPTVATK